MQTLANATAAWEGAQSARALKATADAVKAFDIVYARIESATAEAKRMLQP